jgi:hypothetical protein
VFESPRASSTQETSFPGVRLQFRHGSTGP